MLVLDSLEDPQNVGTLLRSAEAAGVHGVIFPVRRQAPLTPAAVKASAGAVEHLLLCPVDDLGGALADLHGRGLRIAGSEADAPLTARQSDLRGPLAIVVGSEGQGLGPTVRRRCDLFMRIPMRGAVGSLNAAVAGSILLFEAVAQRDPEGRSRAEPPAAWPTPPRPAPAEESLEPAATDDAMAPPRGPAGSEPDLAKLVAAGPPGSGTAESAALEVDAPSAGEGLLPGAPVPDIPKPKRSRASPKSRAARPAVRQPPALGIEGRAPALRPGTLDPSGRAALSSPGAGSGHLRYGPACRADVAQLVEQRFCKPQVPGSSPVVGSSATFIGRRAHHETAVSVRRRRRTWVG